MHRIVDRNHIAGRRIVWSRWVVFLAIVLAGVVTSLAPTEMAIAKTRHRHGVTPQIINGTPVPPGQDRFVVALLDMSRGPTQFDQQFCGGSVIGRQYILTAAHCMEDPNLLGHLSVLVDQVELDSGAGVVIDVKSAQIDPNFDASSIQNDAAVLTLAQKIPRQRSQRIAVDGAGDGALTQAGDSATVAGWGNTNPDQGPPDYPTHLMQADVQMVADTDCATAYHGNFHQVSMVCAAGNSPSRDSCQGDSGGPLFADANSAHPVQIGIVSWGNGCAQAEFPGVYTRLSDPDIASWIHQVTANHAPKKHRG